MLKNIPSIFIIIVSSTNISNFSSGDREKSISSIPNLSEYRKTASFVIQHITG